jgi:hypothetical protein
LIRGSTQASRSTARSFTENIPSGDQLALSALNESQEPVVAGNDSDQGCFRLMLRHETAAVIHPNNLDNRLSEYAESSFHNA